MAKRKGNKIKLTLELDYAVNIHEAKDQLVDLVTKHFSDRQIVGLKTDIAELIMTSEAEE